MEERIKQAFPKKWTWEKGKSKYIAPAHLIRYADDFVILHDDLEVVLKCREIISEWLSNIGLELKDAIDLDCPHTKPSRWDNRIQLSRI